MGSNAIRIVIAEFRAPARFREIASERVAVRLGRYVYRTGRLDEEALEGAVGAMVRFRSLLDEHGVERYRAVATSAVRDAANRDELVRRVRKASRVELEVVSGPEEARLVCRAAAHRLPLGGKRWLLADVGGGSIELAVFDREGVAACASHPLGAVRLLEEAGDAENTGRIERVVAGRLAGLQLPEETGSATGGLVGAGGNIEVLAQLAHPSGDARTVSVHDLERLVAEIGELPARDRRKRWGLEEDRADVILPAGLLYLGVARLAGHAAIHVPRVGVKEGAILGLAAGA